MGFYVYVLGTKKKPFKTYVGWTKDVRKRLKKHNLGLGAKFTRGRKWKLLYFESLKSKSKAMAREYQIKKDGKFRKLIKSKIL
jgi:putative endonuclease